MLQERTKELEAYQQAQLNEFACMKRTHLLARQARLKKELQMIEEVIFFKDNQQAQQMQQQSQQHSPPQ